MISLYGSIVVSGVNKKFDVFMNSGNDTTFAKAMGKRTPMGSGRAVSGALKSTRTLLSENT